MNCQFLPKTMRSPFKSLRIVIIVFCVSCCQVERTSADEAIGSRTGATGAEAFEGDGEPISFGFQRYGFFNGGGGKSYRVRDGRLTMDWERGNNTGDVFFPGPKEFQCLANLQDSVQVDVRVNRDGKAIGDAGGGLYRSGPGLYLAQNRGGQVGVKGRHSISFVIGNETNDATNARCLLALSSLGAYSEGKQLASKPGVWKVGEWVTLRATYSSQDDDGHHYRFEYRMGAKFVELGMVTSQVRLSHAGFQFQTSLFDNDSSDVKFPVRGYMDVDNFRPAVDEDARKLAARQARSSKPTYVRDRPARAMPPPSRFSKADVSRFWRLIPEFSGRAAKLTLIGRKQQPVTIVYPPGGRVARFAATELQKYLDQMTGQRPAVSSNPTSKGQLLFLINADAVPDDAKVPKKLLPEVGTDAFAIRTYDDRMVIAGGSERAVLFGVYDFLERVGCRWFGPLEEHVPKVETLEIPALDIHEKPALRWRGLEFIAGSDPACVDWMTKLKLNAAWPEKYIPNKDMSASRAQMEATAVPAMIDRGLTIMWGGHILPQLLSPETYADHPDYFAKIGESKRLDPNVDYANRTQLCTSNDEAMRELTQNVVRFLKSHPWIDVLFIWAGDTTEWCGCKNCRALEASPDRKSNFGGLDRSASYSRMIKIINEGSQPGMRLKFDGVQQIVPDRRIAFNHYYNLEDLPLDGKGRVRKEVLPGRSVLSAVDAYRQCDRHAFDDEDCPKGKRIRPIARMWAPHYPESVSWSYYWSWNFMKGLPISMVNKIPRDFQFVRSLGINGVIDNVSLVPSTMHHFDHRPDLFVTDHWRYNILNFYIYGKAAWNPDLDVDVAVSDFIERYYGPAAAPMKEFWTLMEQGWVQFGRMPEFMPDDELLQRPETIHGWVLNIRHVIPNRRIFDRLSARLQEARFLAASASDQPLKVKYMPYLERVQLLERAIAVWPSTKPNARPTHK